MNKLIYVLLNGFFMTIGITQTYANSNPGHSYHDESFNDTKWALEQVFTVEKKIKGIRVTANDLVPKITSKLFLETDYFHKPNNRCLISIPKSFEPSPIQGHLVDIETIGIIRINVKIYNSWGIMVAESSLYNGKSGVDLCKGTQNKLKLRNNDVKFHQEMQEGIYYYVLEIHSHNGDISSKEGEIMLLETQKK
jgi:hypothetical protein